MDDYEIIVTPDAEDDLNELDDEPWHSRGIRRMNARNFAVFFNIDEEYKEVYIQNVIYQKRSLPRVLRELYPNLDEL